MIIEKSIKVEKDVQEIVKGLVDLVDCIVNKKDYTILLAELIPMIEGAATILESSKTNLDVCVYSAAIELSRLINVLTKKESVA